VVLSRTEPRLCRRRLSISAAPVGRARTWRWSCGWRGRLRFPPRGARGLPARAGLYLEKGFRLLQSAEEIREAGFGGVVRCDGMG